MDLVDTRKELTENIDYLDRARANGDQRALDLIRRGTCFVVYGDKAPFKFAPSRFVGYKKNTFDAHAKNKSKDGRDTNPAISEILGSLPNQDASLDSAYCDFCRSLGFNPNASGAFGAPRKYWDLRG